MQAQYPWTKEIVGSETAEVRAVNGRSVLGGMQVPNQIAEVLLSSWVCLLQGFPHPKKHGTESS